MLIIYLVFIFLALLSFIELFCKKNRKLMHSLIAITMLLMIVLSSLRGGIAGDYIAYKKYFESVVDTSKLLQMNNFHFEILYSLLQYLIKYIFNSFQIFVFTLACIVMILQYRFAMEYTPDDFTLALRKKTCNSSILTGHIILRKRYPAHSYPTIWGTYFFTVIFILWGIYKVNIIVIRSTISLCICFYATKFIVDKSWKKFFLCALIAYGFHSSAAIFLPAYNIYYFHTSLKLKLIALIVGSVIFSAFIFPLAEFFGNALGGMLEQKINAYLSATDLMMGEARQESFTVLVIKAMFNIGFILLIAIYLWDMHKFDRKFEGYFNLYIVGCILYVATLSVGYAFARLSIYYNIFQVPIILYLISSNKYSSTHKLIHWFLLFLYLTLRFTSNHIYSYASYVFFWE